MGSLFDPLEQEHLRRAQPLALRMRPTTLEEFVGQRHLLGEGKLLRRMVLADRLSSLILYGPPGTGKTSLAWVLAHHTRAHFVALNAAAASVKEVREVLEGARQRLRTTGRRTVLFLDEIHRFNRAQQDVLLADLEDGTFILVGAANENPFFSCTGPLLSRSQVFQLEPLSPEDVLVILKRAITDHQRGLGEIPIEADSEALLYLATVCDGDARRALNALEIAVLSSSEQPVRLTLDLVRECVQQKVLPYDRAGDYHYDLASAFIKSMRGSDPDAAIYWMARMLEAGEDPRFVARRVVICASEDVGNADPMALVVASAALQAAEFVGLPECKLILAQAALYVATAPKSNACAQALWQAETDIHNGPAVPVPPHLRDAHYAGAQRLGHGVDYLYPHNYPGGWVAQSYLPFDRHYYEPVDRGFERVLQRRLEKWRKAREQPQVPPGHP
jgi:putative ATPase